MSTSIAQAIEAEHAREVAAVFTAFADELETILFPNDPISLRVTVKRARQTAELWLDYAGALQEGPEVPP